MRKEGGVPIQFSGDGVTAVFGLEVGRKRLTDKRLRQPHKSTGDCMPWVIDSTQELGWAADFVIHLHTGLAGVGETGDNATRHLAAVGNTIDVARQLAAQHNDGETWANRPLGSGDDCRGPRHAAANWREISLPNDARLKVLRSLAQRGCCGPTRSWPGRNKSCFAPNPIRLRHPGTAGWRGTRRIPGRRVRGDDGGRLFA